MKPLKTFSLYIVLFLLFAAPLAVWSASVHRTISITSSLDLQDRLSQAQVEFSDESDGDLLSGGKGEEELVVGKASLKSALSGASEPHTLIVKLKAGKSLSKIVNRFSLSSREQVDGATHVVSVPELISVESVERVLRNDPEVEYVEPNYIMQALYVPNDPYYNPYQWNFPRVGSETAWNTTKGKGVVVAVVDTGVAYENYKTKYKVAPDLVGTSFIPGFDFVSSIDRNGDGDYGDRREVNDTHANDENGHGTHVAGTIAQTTNNSFGTAGLAFEATIMPVRVLDAFGSGYTSWVASGIRYAADRGAEVINLSLGGPASQTLQDAVNYALDKGVVVVAASGNEYASSVIYPAAYPGVIAVGATGYDNVRAVYSNYGSALTLVAPGGNLDQDLNGDRYGDGILQQTLVQRWNGTGDTKRFAFYFFEGTSMATPHVSAAAAMLIANGTAPSAVKSRLESTATDLGAPGYDVEYGYGLLNVAAALQP